MIKQILSQYESDSPGIKSNMYRILSHGQLGGTGKLLILPVDQGFEHGPEVSFAANTPAYEPFYHYQLAIEAGLNAYAAPLGMLEIGANTFAGQIPIILKLNSSNALTPPTAAPQPAMTASVKDALRLGCLGVGYTIYPGSDATNMMLSELKDVISEAKSYGLLTIVWSYPRGAILNSAEYQTAIDVVSYAAHIAALLGAHIIKVKLPSTTIFHDKAMQCIRDNKIPYHSMAERIMLIKRACLGKVVLFSGGAKKDKAALLQEVDDIIQGGGNGSIIGRNTFQRPKAEAMKMLQSIIDKYKQHRPKNR